MSLFIINKRNVCLILFNQSYNRNLYSGMYLCKEVKIFLQMLLLLILSKFLLIHVFYNDKNVYKYLLYMLFTVIVNIGIYRMKL